MSRTANPGRRRAPGVRALVAAVGALGVLASLVVGVISGDLRFSIDQFTY